MPVEKNWGKILSNWAVIIVMIGSILGFAVIASQDNQQAPPDQPPPPGPPTTLDFRADNVEATVIQLLNTMLITAGTNHPTIDEIDMEVYSVEGIGRVASYYSRPSGTSIEGSLVYVAEVSFEAGYSTSALRNRIAEIEYLNSVDVVPYALVALPQTVSLRNDDLNITKEYSFPNNMVQAYVSLESIKDDTVVVSLEVSLAGESPAKLVVYEQYNSTAAPQMVNLAGQFELLALQPRLSFESSTTYGKSLSVDFNKLEEEIAAIDGVESVSMSVSEAFPSMLIELDDDYTSMEQDINNLLNATGGITTSRFFLDQNAFSLQFDLEADFIILEAGILDGLEDLNIGIKEVREPPVNVIGDLNLSSVGAVAIADSMNGLFRKRKLDLDARQLASFNADSLNDPESDLVYIIGGGSFDALVNPGHNPGDLVELDVFFYGIRENATGISAEETAQEAG